MLQSTTSNQTTVSQQPPSVNASPIPLAHVQANTFHTHQPRPTGTPPARGNANPRGSEDANARQQFPAAFPNGSQTLPTPGDGLLCGRWALHRSIEAQLKTNQWMTIQIPCLPSVWSDTGLDENDKWREESMMLKLTKPRQPYSWRQQHILAGPCQEGWLLHKQQPGNPAYAVAKYRRPH
jgi:hypothetical protein